jgi:thioester reductase-like protein
VVAARTPTEGAATTAAEETPALNHQEPTCATIAAMRHFAVPWGDQRRLSLTTTPTLFTGFPGFLTRNLVRELLRRGSRPRKDAREDGGRNDPMIFLVEQRFEARSRQELEALSQEFGPFPWEVVPGDITDPHLGLDEATYVDLAGRVRRVWHLAAVYDLAVKEAVAHRVNVDGTRHVLDFCEACTDFERLLYISTCYVSGDRTGVIREHELRMGQSFKNHYESTKYQAEVEVQQRWGKIPTVIFRPAVVTGNSQTGETDKYDGPYYLIQLAMRMPRFLPFVNIGWGRSVVNIVPVDFAVAAMAEIASQEASAGKVFHIADPDAMPTNEGTALIFEKAGKLKPVGMVPPSLVEFLMGFESVRQLMRMPREIVTYMNLDSRYDVINTLDALDGTGIQCPYLGSYLDTLIAHVQEHPEKEFLVPHEA